MKNKEKLIGSIILCVILFCITIFGYMISKDNTDKSSQDIFIESPSDSKKEAEASKEKGNKKIKVEIKGEVKRPDVYAMEEDCIVKDILEKAGGITSDADTGKVNLAQRLRDGMCVVIPGKASLSQDKSISASVSLNNASDVININTASKEELKKLPSVGDVTADKIIDYREKNGGFKIIEDIKKVDRIGESTFNKLKDRIDVR